MRVAILVCLLAAPALAAPKSMESSPVVKELKDCRAAVEPAARLACYDAAVGRLLDAEAKRDVVVVDRVQVREARKSLFGLALPELKIFGSGDKEADIDQIETTLASAQMDQNARWLFILADNARWRQIDDYSLGRQPRNGDKVRVMRAALGSFKLSVNGASAVRVRREN